MHHLEDFGYRKHIPAVNVCVRGVREREKDKDKAKYECTRDRVIKEYIHTTHIKLISYK